MMIDHVERLLQVIAAKHAANLQVALKRCESPIEQTLLLAYLHRWGSLALAEFIPVGGANIVDQEALGFRFHNEDGGVFVLLLQLTLLAEGRRYRPDMFIAYTFPGHRGVRVAVECDGHEFHERTKEQAERDKERDRDLQAANIHVARFTGSQIYRSPEAAADDLQRFLDALIVTKRADIKRVQP